MSAVFFNDTATTEIYTLSLHDALPIFAGALVDHPEHASLLARYTTSRNFYVGRDGLQGSDDAYAPTGNLLVDRKSTRLNSSHANISYAVFCLKKKIYLQQRTAPRYGVF